MLFKSDAQKVIRSNHTKLFISLVRGSSAGKSSNPSVIREVGGVRNHLQPKGVLSLWERQDLSACEDFQSILSSFAPIWLHGWYFGGIHTTSRGAKCISIISHVQSGIIRKSCKRGVDWRVLSNQWTLLSNQWTLLPTTVPNVSIKILL